MASRYANDEWVDNRPFIEWVKEQGTAEAVIAARCGVSDKWLRGHDGYGRPTKKMPWPVVDAVLTQYGVPLWQLYPELGPDWEAPPHEVILAWCPRCTEPDPEHPQYLLCGTLVVPDNDGLCMWCGEQTGGAEVEPVEAIPHRSMSEQTIYRARALYLDGMGLTDVAVELLSETSYKNENSFHKQLQKEFDHRGWPRRAKGVVNMRHGRARKNGIPVPGYNTFRRRVLHGEPEQPYCAATTKRGLPCKKKAQTGKRFCTNHDPDRREEVLAQIQEMRRRTPIEYLRAA